MTQTQPAVGPASEACETTFAEEMTAQDDSLREKSTLDMDETLCAPPFPIPTAENSTVLPALSPQLSEGEADGSVTADSVSRQIGTQPVPASDSSDQIQGYRALSEASVAVTPLVSVGGQTDFPESQSPSPTQCLIEAQMEEPAPADSQDTPDIDLPEGLSMISDGGVDKGNSGAMAGEKSGNLLSEGAGQNGEGKLLSLNPPTAFHDVQSPDRPAPVTLPMTLDATNRVAEQIVANSDRSIDIALSPEELGRLRLTMTEDNGRLLVTLAADRPETLDLMRRSTDALARELLASGYTGVEFSFSGQDGQNRENQEKRATASGFENSTPDSGGIADYLPSHALSGESINLLL